MLISIPFLWLCREDGSPKIIGIDLPERMSIQHCLPPSLCVVLCLFCDLGVIFCNTEAHGDYTEYRREDPAL